MGSVQLRKPSTIFSSASCSVRPRVRSFIICSPAIFPMAASWIRAASPWLATSSGGGVHPAPVGDDGVALRVAGAGHVPHNPGAVGLVGIPPGHGPAHQVDGGALALHHHLKVGVGLLLPLGEQPLPDDQLGPLAQGGLGLPGGAVHPADLGGVHLQDGVPPSGRTG